MYSYFLVILEFCSRLSQHLFFLLIAYDYLELEIVVFSIHKVAYLAFLTLNKHLNNIQFTITFYYI